MPVRRPTLLLLLGSLVLQGCGGSSGSDSKVGPVVRIAWPSRTRDITGPSAAIKVVVRFPGAGSHGTDLSETFFRPEVTEAVTKAYTLSSPIKPGVHLLRVDFVATEDTEFAPLATATLNVKVGKDGTLKRSDGTDLGTVTADSAVSQIALVEGQVLDAGETTDLMVTATTVDHAVIALTPGSTTFSVTSGTENLRANADGSVTGLAEGTATVVPTVDGKVGDAVSVQVRFAPLPARNVDVAASGMVFDPTRNLIWAALAPDFGTGNAICSIDPATGAIGPSISVGADPSTVAISDDGSELYVGLRGSGAIRQVDLATETAGAQFTLPAPSDAVGPIYPVKIAVQPGHPGTLAASSYAGGNGLSYGPVILDNGVARPNRLPSNEGNFFVWTAPDRIVAYDSAFSSPTSLFDIAVDANGATRTRRVQNVFASGDQNIVRAGGRLYGGGGSVVDETTLSLVGSFALVPSSELDSGFYGPAVNTAGHRAYFVEIFEGGSRLRVFDTQSFLEVASRRIGFADEALDFHRIGEVDLLCWGTSGLAFRTGSHIVFIDDVSGL